MPLLGLNYGVFPPGEHRDELENGFTTLQQSLGKQEANGRWLSPTLNANTYIVAGAGNSWVVPTSQFTNVGYVLVNELMILNIYVLNSTLTVSPSPTNVVSILIPDDYRVKGAVTNGIVTEGRYYVVPAAISVASGVYEICTGQTSPLRPTMIDFTRAAGNFADGLFSLHAQFAIEVTR